MFLGLRPSQARSHFSWVFLSFLSMISRTFLMLSMISLHFSMIFLGFPEFPRYVDELSKLQDSMPADSLELVEKLLTKDREITRWGFPTNRCCAQLASAPFPKKTHHERRIAYFRRFGDSENCGGLRFHRVRQGDTVIPSGKYGVYGVFYASLCWARSWEAPGGNTFSWIQGQCWAARPLRRPSADDELAICLEYLEIWWDLGSQTCYGPTVNLASCHCWNSSHRQEVGFLEGKPANRSQEF